MVDLLTCRSLPLAAELLRFYWYRLADVAVPLCVALALPWALSRWEAERSPTVRGLWGAAVLLPMMALGVVFVEHQLDFRPGGIVQSNPPDGTQPSAADRPLPGMARRVRVDCRATRSRRIAS